MTERNFLQEVLSSIRGRGRRLFDFSGEQPLADPQLEMACEALLSSLGEASGAALAERILKTYESREAAGRRAFFTILASRFGIDPDEAVASAVAYRDAPGPQTMQRFRDASEPRRQELLRRLNMAPGATAKLVAMRTDLLEALADDASLREVDMDFRHIFQSWFNRGFLEARRIDWNSPAVILDRIIRYEAVHEISDWDDLRRRIDLPDRRLYAFFHLRLADDPLIFVEVAFTAEMPATIASILSAERQMTDPERARTAVFYSISNCQDGLRGISFGNLLIKQVVEDLRRELPNIRTFVTLSPVPGFARWLAAERKADNGAIDAGSAERLTILERPSWWEDGDAVASLAPVINGLAAHYLVNARDGNGAPCDPVARFHLGNGARLERINWLADLSAAGLRNGHGVMVNYLYKPEEIERNHESFVNAGTIPASNVVLRLARAYASSRTPATVS